MRCCSVASRADDAFPVRSVRLAVSAALLLAITGCATTSAPLAGTEWQLVHFQSMDDAIGTIRPADPAQFTMRLNADGTVNLRLDCNRANGSWSAESSGDGDSGSFSFGRLAVTRALCPPPNLDERIARDSEYVRTFLLRDGRLHLSLMADAGIYTWEPVESD